MGKKGIPLGKGILLLAETKLIFSLAGISRQVKRNYLRELCDSVVKDLSNTSEMKREGLHRRIGNISTK